MSNRRGAKLPAILGIDLGSSGIRMVLNYKRNPADDTWERLVVENDLPRLRDDPRRDKGSFPSDCSELGKSALVHADVPLETGRSIKYSLYLLAGIADELLTEEFPLIIREKARLEQEVPDFLQQLEAGLLELFRELAKIVRGACGSLLRVVKICLSTPTQCGHDIADVYERVVSKAFGLQKTHVVHCNEAQALAHFMLGHLAELQRSTGILKSDAGIFVDFGGHTASVATYQIRYVEGSAPTFIEVGPSCGTGGGSEEWLWGLVSSRCQPMVKAKLASLNLKLRAEGQPEIPEHDITRHWEAVRGSILSEFLKQKKRAETDTEQFKAVRIPYLLSLGLESLAPEDEAGVVYLSSQVVKECWDAATARAKTMLGARLQADVKAGKKIVTIVHGGTSRAPAMKSLIATICREKGLPPPFFMENLAELQRYDSITVASGAALIGSNNLTVQQALDRGAVFSLQVWQNFETNPARDEKAHLLLDSYNSNGSRLIRVPIRNGDKPIVICDPLYDGHGWLSRMKWYDVDRCYDFLDLSMLVPAEEFTTAEYRFRAQLIGSGDQMKFTVDVERACRIYVKPGQVATLRREQWERTTPEDPDGEETFEFRPITNSPLSVDLYWDRGHNCVLPGREKMTLAEYLGQVRRSGDDGDVEMTDVADDATPPRRRSTRTRTVPRRFGTE